MKKAKKIIIAVAVILVIALAIVGVSALTPKIAIDPNVIKDNSIKTGNTAVYLDGEVALSEDDYTLVGEKGEFQLFYKKADYTIKIVNTKTGVVWSSMMGDDEYIHNADKGRTENTEAVRKKLKRLFDVGYTNFDDVNNKISSIERSDVVTKYHKLENGIALETTYTDIGITFTFEMWIDENGLNVRIPREKMKEDGDYGFLNITVLPMFGAVTDNVENAFVLFPDTSGAIYDVKPIAGRQSPITADVYFPRDFDLDDIESNNQQGIKNAMMPFFGIGKNTSGFVGYVTEGEMNSYVTMNPSGMVYKINRIEPSLNVRKSFSYINPAGKELTQTERKISCGNFAVHYCLASGSETDVVTYSDLANSLRKFLVDEGRLFKAEATKTERVNTNLHMLMTTRVDSMVAEFLQVMTSCDDIENIINAMPDKTKANLRVMLLGWQSTGYNIYPSSGKIANGIGSVKNLFKFLKENGIDGYMVDDYVSASTNSKYFSKQNDAVYNEAKIPVTNEKGDAYVLNAYKEYRKLVNKRLPYFKKNGVDGIGFDKIGWYVFDDYQKGVETNRYQTTVLYNAMINETHKAGMKVAIQRGNAYTLSAADYLYDIPVKGSSYALIDREVPFYQLVVHGYIPYTLDTPGNMAVDYTQEVLKWVELGAEPTFLLTEEMSEKFKDSTVENAFSTEVDNWMDRIVKVTEEFNSKLGFTANNTMTEHVAVAENVYRVTYSNGNKVYINYNKAEVTVDDVAVKAENYTVVKADGSIVG